MSPEDLKQLQDMLNDSFMPSVEKLIDDKLTNAVGGMASVVQGILNIDKGEDGDGEKAGSTALTTTLAIVAALTPLVVGALPHLRATQGPKMPMEQIAPIMDVFSNGMAFGVNAVSIAARAGHPLPDGETFSNLITGKNVSVNSNGSMSAVVTKTSIADEIKRLAG